MADSNKFEEMLEHLVNEDKVKAEEIFHNIVVEKSREIYEDLLETDLEVDEASDDKEDKDVDEASDDKEDKDVDEASDDKDEDEVTEDNDDDDDVGEVDEDFNLDEFEVEGGDDAEEVSPEEADPADDMMADIADMGDEEEGPEGEEEEGDVEERVSDLEDALDELKSEFEDMMAGDEGDEEEPVGDVDMDADDVEADPEMDPEMEPEMDAPAEEVIPMEASDDDEEVDEESKADLTPTEQMREYVEKVTPKMGDSGANTKSVVAGANDMGGDAGNLVQAADEKGMTPEKAKDINSGNVNVPGGKASKSLKANAKGHGAEKKGAGDTAANKKPVIG